MCLDAVGMTSKTEFAALHLPLVLLKFSSLLLLVRQQRSVLFLAGTALLDAAEDHEADKDCEDSDGADDDTTLGTSRQCLPVVAYAGRVLDLLEDLGFTGGAGGMSAFVTLIE